MFYCYATLIEYNFKKIGQKTKGNLKKMLKNSTITPTLRFKTQQNIAQSPFFPQSSEKSGTLRLMLQSSL
jgi:hypothetical protein